MKKKDQILALVQQRARTTKELAGITGISINNCGTYLSRLRKEGKVEIHGRMGLYKIWRATEFSGMRQLHLRCANCGYPLATFQWVLLTIDAVRVELKKFEVTCPACRHHAGLE